MLHSYHGYDVSQEFIYKKIKRYLAIQKENFPEKYQDKDVTLLLKNLKEGNCNGYIGLWIYRVIQKKEQLHFDLINDIVTWDGKESALKNDKLLADKFEEFVNHIMWLQKDFKLLFSNLPQSQLDKHLSFLSANTGLRRHFNFSLLMTEVELQNILSKVMESRLPIVIRCEEHVIAFYMEKDNLRFYDSISKQGVISITPDQLVGKVKQSLFSNFFSFPTRMKLMVDVFGTNDDVVQFPSVKKLTKEILAARTKDNRNKLAQDGTSDAHMAVIGNNSEILSTLINEKASVIDKDSNGLTPLHMAAIHGYDEMIELLLPQCKEIDVRCSAGKTPLDYAIANKKWDTALLLIAKGANLTQENKNNLSALKFVIMDNNVDFIRTLFDQGYIDINLINDQKLLHFAIKHKCFEVGSLFLQKGVNVDLQDGLGNTPMHELLRQPDKVFMQKLLGKNPNLSLGNYMGATPIHMAVKLGNIDFIAGSHRSDALNLPDVMGRRPIHLAVLEKNKDMVNALIKAGAEIDAPDAHGNTALSLAVQNELLSLEALLLASGAFPLKAKQNYDR